MNENWKKQIILFLTAQTISLFGSSLVQYAIIWYITLTTSSGSMMMIATICGFLPQVSISLFAGVWIDRYNRKSIIMLSDTLIALATLLIAISFLMGFKSVWILFAALAVRSFGTGVQTPAVNAFIPQIVPKDKLMKINGINSSINSSTTLLSPAVSGAIISFASIEATFFVDVVTAIIGVGITSLIIAKPYEKNINGTSNWKDIKQGFEYIQKNNFVKQLLLFQLVVLFLISPSAFLTPLLVSRTFGPEIWRLTVSEMVFSGGALIGGFLIASTNGFKNRIHTIIFACSLYGLFTIGLGISASFIVYLVINTLIGIVMPYYFTPLTVLFQEKVPSSIHGRVFSFMQVSTSTALPMGMVVFGPIADIISIQTMLIYCGFAIILTSAYTFYYKFKD